MFRTRMILLTTVVTLAASRPARAESSSPQHLVTASVDYAAPPTCPGVNEFKAVVVRRLGFDPFNDQAPKHVLVLIQADERTLEGKLEWRDENGHWAGDQTFPLRASDCSELVRTMGFALAVQINLLAIEQPAPDTAEPAPERTDSPAKPGASRASVPPGRTVRGEESDVATGTGSRDSTRGTRWSLALGAGASLGAGVLPRAAALGRVFAGAGLGHASLELGGELSMKVGANREDGSGFVARTWLASVAACGNGGPWSACVVAKAGAVEVQGRRIDVPASPQGRALLAGVRLGACERVGRALFFAGRVEGLVNLMRPTVTLDRVPVWTAPVLAGTLGVDVGVIFQ